MTRTRATARKIGPWFERSVADWLSEVLDDDRVDRKVKTGAKDRGDITGVRAHGQRMVLECKNVALLNLSGWVNEAHVEAGNDDALVGVVVHKRRGKSDPGDQYVTCTLRDLVALITGERPDGD